MAAKKKISKKTAAKPAKTAKTAKAAKPAAKSAAAKSSKSLAASTNVSTLEAAGVIDTKALSDAELKAINSNLSASDVATIVSAYGKLEGAIDGGRVRVQLCF